VGDADRLHFQFRLVNLSDEALQVLAQDLLAVGDKEGAHRHNLLKPYQVNAKLMALAKPDQDRIRHLEQDVIRQSERVDNLRLDASRIQAMASDMMTRVQEVEKRLAVTLRDVEELKKVLEELRARRWDLWKLVFAAFLGRIWTLAGSLALRSLDRVTGAKPAPAARRRSRRAAQRPVAAQPRLRPGLRRAEDRQAAEGAQPQALLRHQAHGDRRPRARLGGRDLRHGPGSEEPRLMRLEGMLGWVWRTATLRERS